MTQKGKVVLNGVAPYQHESAIVATLSEAGYDIEMIPKSNRKGVYTPDALVNGIPWEFKSIMGHGVHRIEYVIRKAARQAPNILIDIRKGKLPESKYLLQIKTQVERRANIQHLKVITKSGKILDIK